MTDDSDDSGDAACWLDRVCEMCGGFIDDDGEHVCRQPVPVDDVRDRPSDDT